jgi:KDO2-lipid IV(A) lauroyltransferase
LNRPVPLWKRGRYRLEWIALSLLARFIPCLSRRACVGLAGILGRLAYRLDRRGRPVALENLRLAFGGKYSSAEREAIARASYINFVRTIIDLLWAPKLSAGNFQQYIRLEGVSHIPQPDRTRGAVAMCVHAGNWEWSSLAWGFAGAPAFIVAEAFKNVLLSDLFNSRREISGHQIVPQDQSVLRLLKAARRKGVAGLLVDLNLRPTQPSAIIDAFGMKMCVTILPAIICQRSEAAVVPVTSEPLPDGTCRVTNHPPLSVLRTGSETEISQQIWDFFEPVIRARPELWLWAYKHWRYRPANAPAGAYPFYANVSKAFDRKLASPEK